MRVLVIGGAGFIGANAASRFLRRGDEVMVFDNLSRPGTAANLAWLQGQGKVCFLAGDVRNSAEIRKAVETSGGLDVVLHLAAQVAVTTSVADPREDFEINALGTLNVLEALRRSTARPLIIYSSTNKVYGGMERIETLLGPGAGDDEREGRYRYRGLPDGISEEQQLDFHSPYGCSKGAADQYVRDYSRIYGLDTVVFRQSCIYGPRQFGIEDQGWVAWFTISAVLGHTINIFGDGRQVRDLLHVDDLVDAYLAAIDQRKRVSGRIYNIGGGSPNSSSILGLVHLLERMLGHPLSYCFHPWRPGDQPVYISDVRLAAQELGWRPKVGVQEGLSRLTAWVNENRLLIQNELASLLG